MGNQDLITAHEAQVRYNGIEQTTFAAIMHQLKRIGRPVSTDEGFECAEYPGDFWDYVDGFNEYGEFTGSWVDNKVLRIGIAMDEGWVTINDLFPILSRLEEIARAEDPASFSEVILVNDTDDKPIRLSADELYVFYDGQFFEIFEAMDGRPHFYLHGNTGDNPTGTTVIYFHALDSEELEEDPYIEQHNHSAQPDQDDEPVDDRIFSADDMVVFSMKVYDFAIGAGDLVDRDEIETFAKVTVRNEQGDGSYEDYVMPEDK